VNTPTPEQWIALVAAAACVVLIILYARQTAKTKAAQGGTEQLKSRVTELEGQLAEKDKLAELVAKEEAIKAREQAERSLADRKKELEALRKRIDKKEETLDKRSEDLDRHEGEIKQKQKQLVDAERELEEAYQQARQELQRIAGLTQEQARTFLLSEVEKEVRHDAAALARTIEERAKEESDHKAAWIISQAIQRCAVEQTTETTVSVVPLPSEEMKGRIIGREGRNIRAFEQATGIDLIVDDTPEAVVLSGFDPVRREVAKIALERLVTDGRIHPGRIEEVVAKAQKDVEQSIREAGQAAVLEAGVSGVNADVVKLLGTLQYRTSYGQNVLKHSLEVAHLCAAMASELGTSRVTAKRAGLLHDLGKARDFRVEGAHAQLGAEFASQKGESQEVVHAIAAHHGDEEPKTIEAVLVQAADAISASRPGARRDPLEHYIKRLEGLERIASSFEGVDKCFAIQAGREIRVVVKPDKVDDLAAHRIAKGMVDRIQDELEYPGQIRVTVIRETRVVEYAN
jgi:ribonuclease Y